MDNSPLASFIIKDLTEWVANNKKLEKAITPKNLKLLFQIEFPAEITIDLTLFENEYYNKVFAYFPGKKNIDAFVKKVCLVIKKTLIDQRIPKLIISFYIKNKIRKEKRIVCIHPNYQ